MTEVTDRILLDGVAASPGIVIGRALVLDKDKVEIKPIAIEAAEIDREIADFNRAIVKVKNDLLDLASSAGKRLGTEYGRIFEAQAMIADDKVINEQVISQIKSQQLQAASLYRQQIDTVINQLSQAADPYLKERILDINSVCNRLLSVLRGVKREVVKDIEGPTVVIARYLSPGDLMGFSLKKKFGIAMELGGVTSHTSLLAKSLNLPAIVGIGPGINKIATGDRVILDGYSGKLIVHPEPKTIAKFRSRVKFLGDLSKEIAEIKSQPAYTKDRHRVKVYNNIELPTEIARVIKSGAEGIGLFRTEYLFITEGYFPDFDKQYNAYKSILVKMKEAPVLIRTFDMGGDKFADDRLQSIDPNPFLGWRAIRYCLDHPEVFKTQLMALLKASRYGNLGIMLPMISNLDELRATKELLAECKAELKASGEKFKEKIPLGVMIEVPSAALMAEHLAREVDFFSIGTNDLIQYTLAVDRTNEKLTSLYQSFNPAVLNLIKHTITAAARHKVKVGICGEMASDPLAVILFTGMGVDELSTSLLSTGIIKHVIKNIDYKKAKEMAAKVCRMTTAAEVEEYLRSKSRANFPQLIPLLEFIRGLNHD